jgi:DNA polymerase I-like protein with 3'-5' exonuclease and polymerase domains
MKTRSLLMFAIIASLLAGSLNAQEKKKLYRWVDKDGKVQISDQLPPEAVNQARKEINSKGQSIGTVDRALTDAERSAQADQAAAEALAKKDADQKKMIEDAMLINYATEDDLRRTYKERIDLLQQTIESTDISIKSIRGSLTGMLAQASETELAKRPADIARTKQIQDMHAELLKQQAAQVSSFNDVKSMENELAAVLARYRELRSTATTPPAASAPAATSSPSTPATPGTAPSN